MTHIYTAAVTLLALLLQLGLTAMVGRARARYGVKAPAVTGNEHFERAYRVQMNTIEQMAFFLPALWLCAFYMTDRRAAVGGLVWIAARIVYAVAYVRDPGKRGLGATVSMLVQIALWLGAAIGLARVFLD